MSVMESISGVSDFLDVEAPTVRTGVPYALYLAGLVLFLRWCKRVLCPTLKSTYRAYDAVNSDEKSLRHPVDAAASHLLIQFVVSMNIAPEAHEHLKNLEHDHEVLRSGQPDQTRFRTALGLIMGFDVDQDDSGFRAPGPSSTTSMRFSRLHALDVVGVVVLSLTLIVIGLVFFPLHLIFEHSVDGRATTFILLSHGLLTLIGRLRSPLSARVVHPQLWRPTATLAAGVAGLLLYDLKEYDGSRAFYVVGLVVAATALSIMTVLLGYLAVFSRDNPIALRAIVPVTRIGLLATFATFGVANIAVLATMDSGSVLTVSEYLVFSIAHVFAVGSIAVARLVPKRKTAAQLDS